MLKVVENCCVGRDIDGLTIGHLDDSQRDTFSAFQGRSREKSGDRSGLNWERDGDWGGVFVE